MKLIAGLGNPGAEYAKTRHNLGFMVVDELLRRSFGSTTRARFRSVLGEIMINGEKVIVIKPQTYMNLSGAAIRETANWYKISVPDTLVIVDDLDLPFGATRLRPDGSAGGHNGLKSAIQELGSANFPRLRLGIGRGRSATISHVLSRFSQEEEQALPEIITFAADCATRWVTDGAITAMNECNRKPALIEEKQP